MVRLIAEVVSNVMLCYYEIKKITRGKLNCLNLWPISAAIGNMLLC